MKSEAVARDGHMAAPLVKINISKLTHYPSSTTVMCGSFKPVPYAVTLNVRFRVPLLPPGSCWLLYYAGTVSLIPGGLLCRFH
jgi:hypothetical protein